MCWKFEWAKAYNNLTWVLVHLSRVNKAKRIKPEALQRNKDLMVDLQNIQQHLRDLAENYGIERKSDNRTTEKLLKGNRRVNGVGVSKLSPS